jgi:hypothetical protein
MADRIIELLQVNPGGAGGPDDFVFGYVKSKTD